jgi:hypothetical protein
VKRRPVIPFVFPDFGLIVFVVLVAGVLYLLHWLIGVIVLL